MPQEAKLERLSCYSHMDLTAYAGGDCLKL